MSLTQKSFLPLFLSLIFLLSTITTTTSTLQNLLRSQGLPGGLFPNNVKSYNLDQNGRLEVQLDGPCMTKYEARVVFDSVVRANLSYGGLMGLEGLIQEELFLWFPVKGFWVNDPSSGLILVDIGLAHKQLSQADLLENLGRKMGFQAQR
ncbi:hypothetical protein POTOM_040526 [Populus tomentosa]|uniref:Uncharacterized protein n=1 Tax=Populus tomentosa TaxID=118781 RepID=A0A8X8CI08_POPTO|nr:hypothetical protein POTOM_040526 [Populus tomentosa]